MLFSGVFATGSIFHDGGMVMDEDGRNGGNWHLAQQITYHVTLYIFQQITQPVIMRILSITTTSTTGIKPHNLMHNNNYHTDMSGGIFISFINIKNFPPVSNYNNLQFVNK